MTNQPPRGPDRASEGGVNWRGHSQAQRLLAVETPGPSHNTGQGQ